MNTAINYNTTKTAELQSAISPEMAIDLLKEGNTRFTENRREERNYHEQIKQTSTAQFPIAAVLSCIDSRVPAETVFDQGIGDIFSARIAGNFVNEDILGSLEFACKVAGSKLVVVMGHTGCGAVKGACDGVELGNLTAMLKKINPAVESVQETENRTSSNPEFVQKVADANVQMTIEAIRSQSEVLREMEQASEIQIIGAMYDVASGKVEFRI